MQVRTTPPFRADHVGSLLRPAALLRARAQEAERLISAEALRHHEDEAIAAVVRMQEDLGLQSASDGELRRAWWHMDFIYRLRGVSQVPGTIEVPSATGGLDVTSAASKVDGRIGLDETIFGDDFAYLRSVVRTASPKLTIPSANMVTTKRPQLESKDDLKRRIDEAARYVPLEQLCLSPQCGFSSTVEGNALTEDQERAKLALVVETTPEVWGSPG